MIKLENVEYKYSADSEVSSIKNLNLHIKKGEVVVLCGRSGSGKTTVARLINGLIPHLYEGVLTGSVEIDGRVTKDVELSDLAESCGSVFQNPKSQFFNTDTTGELAFGCENMNYSKEKTKVQMDKTVSDLSLSHLLDRNIFMLSGGEKQQIACGSIYATNPEIYVLDEPSSNMDASAIERFRKILVKLKEQGKTIVISEHRLYFLMDLADRFLFFADGELKESYTNEEMKSFSPLELSQKGFRATDLNQVQLQSSAYSEAGSIKLNNILCKRSGKTVLDIEKLSLPTNSVIAIIGENGAGKSTFAEVLTGLLKSKGEVEINGKNVKQRARTAKSYVVMQDVNRQLFSNTVKTEVILGGKKGCEERADEIMKQLDVDMFSARHPASLSGGQKQRVAICSAITAEKDIMVYDEPTSGLDYVGMKNLCSIVTDNRGKHLITAIITHDIELVLGCCTHVLHISKSKVKDFYKLNSDSLQKIKEYFIVS